MKRSKESYISNPEALKSAVKEIVRAIHHDENPNELNEFRRFLKRYVSIFNRGYFSAYLLKQLAESESGRPRREKDRTRGRDRERERTRDNDRKETQVSSNETDESKTTLFVSVGKNRKVYPRDLITLFADNDEVDPAQFGQIKILDNYSFVDVEPEISDKIIELYNGTDFRGRKLTVNFARKKQ